jgi:hypothetical protein
VKEHKPEPMTKEEENFWIWMLRRNNSEPILQIEKSWKIKRFKIRFSWRSAKNTWGRFGGGWNWKCGFSIGGTCIYFHLLIADLSFSYSKP